MNPFFVSLFSGGSLPAPDLPKVFFDTGQSNDEGRALNSNATSGELSAQPNVQIWQSDIQDFEQYNAGAGNIYAAPNCHDMWLGFAQITPEPVYVVKWAVGATDILEHLPGGSVYDVWVADFVNPAKAWLDANVGAYDAYVTFRQGERDSTNQPGADAYQGRFDTWTAQMKTLFGNNVKIRPFKMYESDARDIQINGYFDAKALTEPNMVVIQSQSLDLLDTVHFSYQGQKDSAQLLLNSLV